MTPTSILASDANDKLIGKDILDTEAMKWVDVHDKWGRVRRSHIVPDPRWYQVVGVSHGKKSVRIKVKDPYALFRVRTLKLVPGETIQHQDSTLSTAAGPLPSRWPLVLAWITGIYIGGGVLGQIVYNAGTSFGLWSR